MKLVTGMHSLPVQPPTSQVAVCMSVQTHFHSVHPWDKCKFVPDVMKFPLSVPEILRLHELDRCDVTLTSNFDHQNLISGCSCQLWRNFKPLGLGLEISRWWEMDIYIYRDINTDTVLHLHKQQEQHNYKTGMISKMSRKCSGSFTCCFVLFAMGSIHCCESECRLHRVSSFSDHLWTYGHRLNIMYRTLHCSLVER